jgi:hypothetical protein
MPEATAVEAVDILRQLVMYKNLKTRNPNEYETEHDKEQRMWRRAKEFLGEYDATVFIRDYI